MINFFSKRECWGTHRTYKESLEYDKIIKDVFNATAEEVYGTANVQGIAVFAYGSPGRFELTGGDSDADVFIAEKKRTKKGTLFRKLLEERWGAHDFSKIDLPPWGEYREIEKYLEISLVEGNQVLETRFLCGDPDVREGVEERIRKYDSPRREIINIIFNRLYFNQYFRQRIIRGDPNVKYYPGGSRDFLFFYWYDRLCNKMNKEESSLSGLTQPKIKEGLERLFMEGAINGKELGLAFEGVNGIIELRTDILKLNKGTSRRGLTVLDDPTISGLQREYGYPEKDQILLYFDKFTSAINRASRVVWEQTIKKASYFNGKNWGKQFILAYSPSTPEEDRAKISPEDTSLRIGLIWGASESGQKDLFDFLAKQYHNSKDWGTLCSLVSSPLCNPDILYEIGTGRGKEEGYGYILRVVARNKNVSEQTLRSIAENPNLEKRYTEVAKAALEGGFEAANSQI